MKNEEQFHLAAKATSKQQTRLSVRFVDVNGTFENVTSLGHYYLDSCDVAVQT